MENTTSFDWGAFWTCISGLFTFLSFIFSVWSAYNKSKTEKAKKDITNIKDDIIKYQNHIKEKKEALKFQGIKNTLEEIQLKTQRLARPNFEPEKGSKKAIIDYYGDIRDTISELQNIIPLSNQQLKDNISALLIAFNFLVNENITFNNLNKDSTYNYLKVDQLISNSINLSNIELENIMLGSNSI